MTDVVDEKIKMFDTYLERTHMDKKDYQYARAYDLIRGLIIREKKSK